MQEGLDGETEHPEAHLSPFSPKATGTIMGTLLDSPQDTIRYEFGSCVVNTRTLGRNGQAIVIQRSPACVL